MEMIEILRERLPKGLEIKKVYDRTGSSNLKITFSLDGHEHIGWLNKTCAPGNAEKVCDFSICAVMVGIALEQNDFVAAKYWTEKQRSLNKLI